MALAYRGLVDVLLIAADGSEHRECFPAILNETMPGRFELSTPHKLPAARGSHTVCVTLDDGQSLGVTRNDFAPWRAGCAPSGYGA